jgi:pimeloyl-ACP methyl ester carboxylesterase
LSALESGWVETNGLRLHYLAAGAGSPLLLLHGWPTSSFLWRNIIGPLAARHRVLALDLPGFGKSDKPLDAKYDFAFFSGAIDHFLEALHVDRLGLVVHDLGGPIGLYWASQHSTRIERLALLNTVVYPELSFAVRAFVAGTRVPGVRALLSSAFGLRRALHLGIKNRQRLAPDALEGLSAPFREGPAREALLKAGGGLRPSGLRTIARWLPTIRFPVRVIYGAADWILPDIEETVRRLRSDVPQVEVTRLEAGHFLQEERPAEVAALLAAFFAGPP